MADFPGNDSNIAKRDQNYVPTMIAVSSVDGKTPVVLYADPTTHRLYVDMPASGGITGSGSFGQVSFWNGTNTQTGDNGLFWDNTNKRLGLGTTTPANKLEVIGGQVKISNASDALGAAPLIVQNTTPYGGSYYEYSQIWLDSSGSLMSWIRNDGTFYIGGDQGQMRPKSINYQSGESAIGLSDNNLTLRSKSTFNGHVLLLPDGTGAVGIGTSSPTKKLEVSGDILISGAGSSLFIGGTKARMSAKSTTGAYDFNYNTTATGDLTFYGGGTSSVFKVSNTGNVTANSFIKSGGTASQFLKADGSVDSNTYITSSGVSGMTNGQLAVAGSSTTITSSKAAPSGVILGDTDSQTTSNKRNLPRIYNTTSLSTLTPEVSTYDNFEITALAANLTIANHATSTANNGEKMIIRIKDNGTARTLSYGTYYRSMGNTLPTTTVVNKTMYLGFIWNNADSRWDMIALAIEN